MSEFTENEYDLIYEWASYMLASAHIKTIFFPPDQQIGEDAGKNVELDFNLSECPVEHFMGLTDIEIKTAQAIMKKVKKLMYGR